MLRSMVKDRLISGRAPDLGFCPHPSDEQVLLLLSYESTAQASTIIT